MSKENVTRRISIYVNGKEVENSLKGVDGEIQHVRNSLRKLVEGTEDYDKKKAELTKNLSQLTERQREYREELGLTKKAQDDVSVSMNNTKEAFSKLFVGITSGDLSTAKEGFDEIKGSIGGMVQSAMAFIATPLGAAIAVVSGIAIGTKAIFDFNEGLQKSNNLLSAFGLEGAEMKKVRAEISATAKTFDKEFEEIAGKANSLAKTFKISMSEANEFIARGLADGGAQNSEFLDSLGEYDEFFAKAGYSASEFINIVNKGFDLGIYSDKLPDALKEADLSLKEQTKASRDALTNAFGASFTDEILAKVSTGQITTKKALEEIAIKAKETGLSQQQNAQLTADVFRGAGEDAGGALKVLEAVGAAAQKEMSESTKASLDLVEANEKLNKVQSKLFEIDNFGTIWTNIKASAIDTLSSILEWVLDVKTDIQPLIDFVGVVFVNAWNALKLSVQVAFALIGGILKQFSNVISTTFNFVKKILQGDFAGALDVLKNGFIQLATIVERTFGNIKNHIIDGLKAIVDNIAPFLEAIGLDVDKIQKKLNSVKYVKKLTDAEILELQKNSEKIAAEKAKADKAEELAKAKATAEELAKQKAIRDAARQKEIEANQRALDKKKAAQEKHDKEIADMAIALAKSKTDLAKAELDYFIANNRSKIDKEKQLTPELIAEEIKRLEDIKFLQENALADKRLADIAKAEQEAKSAEELANLKKIIDLDYLTAQQNLELQFLDTTTALKKQYEEQQKVLAAEQLKAENEIKIGQLNDEFAIKQETERQRYDSEKSELDKRLKEGYITKTQYLRLLKIAEDNHSKATIAISRAERDARLSAYGELFGNIAKLLGENTAAGKAAALAQVAISQGLAIAKIWETPSTLPSPFDVAAKVAGTAVAVGNVIGAAKQINSVKTPKFFYGGFNNSDGAGGSTGTTAYLGTDEYGKITGVTHDEEWVAPKIMTKSPKYAATFSWLENERKAIVGNKYFNGGETSTGTVSPYVASTTQNDERLLNAINRLNEHLDKGIQSKILFGYKDAKEIQDLNRERENSNQFGIVNQ